MFGPLALTIANTPIHLKLSALRETEPFTDTLYQLSCDYLDLSIYTNINFGRRIDLGEGISRQLLSTAEFRRVKLP